MTIQCCSCAIETEDKDANIFVVNDEAHVICRNCQVEFTQCWLDLTMAEVEWFKSTMNPCSQNQKDHSQKN